MAENLLSTNNRLCVEFSNEKNLAQDTFCLFWTAAVKLCDRCLIVAKRDFEVPGLDVKKFDMINVFNIQLYGPADFT